MSRMQKRAHRGLSMIEVLAAMVIFSSGAVVLFGWLGDMAGRLGKLSLEQQHLFAELTAIDFARSLNPMQQPTGSTTIGEVMVSWRATPIGTESPVRMLTGSTGLYVVQLYDVDVQAEHPKAGRSTQKLYLAGWRQTAEARRDTPFGFEPGKP
jgi:general secretion pathway protein I